MHQIRPHQKNQQVQNLRAADYAFQSTVRQQAVGRHARRERHHGFETAEKGRPKTARRCRPAALTVQQRGGKGGNQRGKQQGAFHNIRTQSLIGKNAAEFRPHQKQQQQHHGRQWFEHLPQNRRRQDFPHCKTEQQQTRHR